MSAHRFGAMTCEGEGGRKRLHRTLWLAYFVWLICLCAPSVPLRAAVETPTVYVVDAFKDHDIVFLGERHLVKNNLDFLVSLIPALHAGGIHNLGWEFASSADQPLIDRLLSGETYDKGLAYAIILGWRQPGNVFAYEEYAAVYHAAWALNRKLPAGAQPFRIVALDLPGDRPGVDTASSPSVRRPASWIDVNIHWAQVIQQAFVDSGQKALVYCGSGHTTTRFYNWREPQGWDFGGVPRVISAGNLVYHNVGKRTARILLHGAEEAWGSEAAEFGTLQNIERAAMPMFSQTGPFGTDLASSPLGTVPVPRKGYVDGKSTGFTLSDLADGYVFLAPVAQWSPVTPLADFVTSRNRWTVQSLLPGYHPGDAEKPIAQLNAVLADVASKAVAVARERSDAARDDSGKAFTDLVDIEDQVRIPMRDGIRLNATLFFLKGKPRRNLPTLLSFGPYRTSRGISDSTLRFLEAGYAVAYVTSRGRYFSEGVYKFLGGSGNDSYDTVEWLSKQSWSNGKVGAMGCSSSAEEQHRMNAMHHPAFAAAVPRSSGAGIGRVGPYNEMGNFFRGGVFQNLWLSWYHQSGYRYRPSFQSDLSRETMLRLGRYWDQQPQTVPEVDFDKVVWTLPLYQILRDIGSAPSDLEDFLTWPVNDPRWKAIEFGNEGDRNGAPALYINAWYDMSIGPNLAMFEYQSKNAANATARDNTFLIVAPTTHCNMGVTESEHTVVGERDTGDARFDYQKLILRWYDHWLKGIDNGVTREPKVRVYTMGANRWSTYDAWPPREARPITYYLQSDGGANTLHGNGRLSTTRSGKAGSDSYTYDPLNPTPSVGGQVCCFAVAQPGSFDQSQVESRPDVLVYTSKPLSAPLEVTGSIPVTLYLSSDVKDTDLMVRLVDVYPDGKAYNLDEQVLRVRWREGYEQPVFMQPGHVYKVQIPPLVTSNAFLAGHRIRVAITSSSFPVYERNLNTGGRNYDEKDPLVAHNVIHHGPAYPSAIVLPIVPAAVRR